MSTVARMVDGSAVVSAKMRTDVDGGRAAEVNGRENEDTDVVMVVISYDMAKFQSMLADIKETKEELQEASPSEKEVLEARLRELRAPWSSSGTLRSQLPCTGQAVVVLRSQTEHREVLEEWDTFYEWLMTSMQCLKINSRQPRFRGRHVVRISRAANPSDILWENLGTSHRMRLWLRAKTYGIVALIFLVCLILVVALNWTLDWALGRKNTRNSGALATFSSLLVALVVMLTRLWASRTLRQRVMRQMHETKTTRDVSLLAKLALFYLMAYCLIAVLVNWDPAKGEWYTVGGLVSDISSLMLINCISIPLQIAFGCKLLLRYQAFFELPDMDQTRPFAKVLIAAVALFLEYWAFKASKELAILEIPRVGEHVDYYVAQRAWPKHQKYHTTNTFLRAVLAKFPPPGTRAAQKVQGFEILDAKARKLQPRAGKPQNDDEDDSDKEVDETKVAVAAEDPAALAMEEMKHKVPLSMLDAEADTEDEDEDGSGTDESDEEPGRRRDQDVLWCWLLAMRRALQLSARFGVHRDMWDFQQNAAVSIRQ
ncbi:nipblb [Symbiodinium sp. CCMP2592]|nr:nipblb [Symbiodinium sp. CCMP2592]